MSLGSRGQGWSRAAPAKPHRVTCPVKGVDFVTSVTLSSQNSAWSKPSLDLLVSVSTAERGRRPPTSWCGRRVQGRERRGAHIFIQSPSMLPQPRPDPQNSLRFCKRGFPGRSDCLDEFVSGGCCVRRVPLSSECGRYVTVEARFRPWLSDTSPPFFKVVASSLGRRLCAPRQARQAPRAAATTRRRSRTRRRLRSRTTFESKSSRLNIRIRNSKY